MRTQVGGVGSPPSTTDHADELERQVEAVSASAQATADAASQTADQAQATMEVATAPIVVPSGESLTAVNGHTEGARVRRLHTRRPGAKAVPGETA